jgi:GNAT superfamily N-acetyltransferase
MSPTKCSTLTFHVSRPTDPRRVDLKIEAIDGITGVGGMITSPDRKLGELTVSIIRVKPPYQRCGIATRMYEIAGKYACANGLQLASDVTRSDEADLFWQKQAAKGRARRYTKTADGETYARGDAYYVLSCPVETLSRRRRRMKTR